jgi:hypothetical protein
MDFKEPQKWVDWIPAAESWYNTIYHTSLKKSPFEALYGYKPPQLGVVAIPCNVASEVEVTLLEQENAMKALQHNLKQAQNRMKKFADLNKTER